MIKNTQEVINRFLSSCSRFLRTQSREEELRVATVKEATKKAELEKILDAERELTKARADNNQLRKAIESVRAERAGVSPAGQARTGSAKKDSTPKRTI